MDNSQLFDCEVDFCPVCGMILSLPSRSTFVECKNKACNYKIEIESKYLKNKVLLNFIYCNINTCYIMYIYHIYWK